MDVFNTALYGGIVPGLLALAFAGLALVQTARGHACRRLAAWIIPLAAAGGLVIAYTMRFGGDVGRWQWIIPAAAALLVLWAAALAFWPGTLRGVLAGAILVALTLGLTAGGLMWATFYEMQPMWMRLLPALATAVLAGALYPLALTARPSDGLAVSTAGALLVPVVVFSGNLMFAELLMPVISAGAVASVLAMLVRGERWAPWRRGLCAGAIGIALVLPQFAILAWSNGYDLTPRHAWSLALPALAPLLLWGARINAIRRWPMLAGAVALLLVTGLAAAGLLLALTVTDTASYDPGF